MRAENYPRSFGHFTEFVNENRACGTELVDYVAIMYDLFADIYRCSIQVEDYLDNVDRPNDSRTEPARFEQDNRPCGGLPADSGCWHMKLTL